MNYYALFLDNNGYIEKCLSLIRAISNPNSSSLPHITLRLFKETNSNLEYIKNINVSYLNIIEPGAFSSSNKAPFVVYIRCESEELESIEYKPDYPFSRLHITLYEGSDAFYAKELFSLLSKIKWHFKLSFNTPLKLTERKIGSKSLKKKDEYLNNLYGEVLGASFIEYPLIADDNYSKLRTIEKILIHLQDYIDIQFDDSKKIISYYSKRPKRDSKKYIDASANRVRYKNDNQLSFDIVYPDKAPEVNKQVQDAIYVTPPEYARDMAKCALDAFGNDARKIDFGDSAIGTGALFLALKQWVDTVNEAENKRYEVNSAIGVDIDKKMAEESFIRYSKRGLAVIYGDAISPDINLGSPRNLMLVNPPYNRHENIPTEYRKSIRILAEKQTGIKILGDAGLYVYHLLIMDKWLAENGVASWLLPSIFLQSRYGEAIRQYLLNNVQLLRLHVYDEVKQQFDNTYISTTIVTFCKHPTADSTEITVSYGDSLMSPSSLSVVKAVDFENSIRNWRKLVYGRNKTQYQTNSDTIKFDDLFDIKRGLATGANSFFVLNREEAKHIGIPNFALKPLLPKARNLNSLIINAQDDGFPDVSPQLVLIDCDLDENTIHEKYPSFFRYLEAAKQKDKNGKAIIDRTLVRGRHPWYKQEKRDAPPFLLTYMGRTKTDLPPLYFILNKSSATALNTYILLYPKKWLDVLLKTDPSLYEQLLSSLNHSAEHIIAQQTRIYAGGLQKLEPGELKGLPIIDVPPKIVRQFSSNANNSNGFLYPG